MKISYRLLLAPLLGLASPSLALQFVDSASTTPVEKVINLLGKLTVQLEEEGAREAAQYDKYACFCKHQADEKTYQIEKSEEKLAKLAAKIEELGAKITALDGEVSELSTAITTLEGGIKTETDARSGERETYLANDKDTAEAIAAVDEAIEILQASKGKLGGGAKLNFAELKAVAGAKLAQFFAKQKPPSYEYRSNDIILTLQELSKTFKSTKKSQDEEEFAAAAASEKKVLALSNEKKFKVKSKAQKEALSAELSEEKAGKEKEQTDETAAKNADTEFRTELTKQCEDKAQEWDQRSKSRAEELRVLAEATATLKSGVAPNYSANKKLVGLAATSASLKRHTSNVTSKALPKKNQTAVSLLQLGRGSGSAATAATKVLASLAKAAEHLKSAELSALAARASTMEDHFEKVRGLIKDLVAKLEAEALEEADAKSYCDKEMAAATSDRDTRSAELESAKAELVGKEAAKAQLVNDIKTLSQEVADLNKAMMEATELRQIEKTDNAKTVADASTGKAAVEEAMNILKTYYQSLLQKSSAPVVDREGKALSDLTPETFEGEYHGNTDASKGILGLLEVIYSDFERTVSTVETAESDAQSAFQTFETETKSSISDKESLIKTKEAEVEQIEEAIVTAKETIQTTFGLKTSALEELEKLSAMCVGGAESYEERQAQREKEIQALKEALQTLEDWKN